MGTVPMDVILLRLRQKEFKYQCSRSFKLLYVHLKKIVKKNIFPSVFLTHLKRQRGPACTQCTPSSSQYGPIWREDVLCCICCYTTDPKYRIFQATNNKIKQSVPLTKASTAKQVLFHTWAFEGWTERNTQPIPRLQRKGIKGFWAYQNSKAEKKTSRVRNFDARRRTQPGRRPSPWRRCWWPSPGGLDCCPRSASFGTLAQYL